MEDVGPPTPPADFDWDDDLDLTGNGFRAPDSSNMNRGLSLTGSGVVMRSAYSSRSGSAASDGLAVDTITGGGTSGLFGTIMNFVSKTVRGHGADPDARANRSRLKLHLRSQHSRTFGRQPSVARSRSGAVVKQSQRRQAQKTQGKYRLGRAFTPLNTKKHLVQCGSGAGAEYADNYGRFNPYSLG